MTRRKLERDRLGATTLGRLDGGTRLAARNSLDTVRVVSKRVVALDVGVLGGSNVERADGESVSATADARTAGRSQGAGDAFGVGVSALDTVAVALALTERAGAAEAGEVEAIVGVDGSFRNAAKAPAALLSRRASVGVGSSARVVRSSAPAGSGLDGSETKSDDGVKGVLHFQ